MKTQNIKPDTDKNAIRKKPLWTTIPNQAQEVITGGLGYKHIHLNQIGQSNSLMQEFEAELATLGARVD